MNQYKTTSGSILRVYPEPESMTVAFSLKSAMPADKHVCYFELEVEEAKDLSEYILVDILSYHIVNPEMVRDNDPELYKAIEKAINDHIGKDNEEVQF